MYTRHRFKMIMLTLSLGISVSLPPSCKTFSNRPKLSGFDDSNQRLSTKQLAAYLQQKTDLMLAKPFIDGTKPEGISWNDADTWDWYVDPLAASRIIGAKIRTHRDFFTAEVSLPNPSDPSTQPALNVPDNLMSYRWFAKDGERLQNPDDWFVHIIPQRFGDDQPEMLRFLKDGDLIVYFRPEYRGDNPSSLREWRATHAATLFEANVASTEINIQLLPIDTPASYTQPFRGYGDTPFHVFRFIPREDQAALSGEAIKDEYRRAIAKWATLAFDKFNFQGNYNVMAERMPSGEAEVLDEFKNNYLKAGMGQEHNLARMYCSWFVFTNLTLAWARPFSPEGLGAETFNELRNTQFGALTDKVRYGAGMFDSDYAAPLSVQNQLARRDEFPFEPMTAPELVLGFIDRVFGPDALIPADQLSEMMIAKAMVLRGLSKDETLKDTLLLTRYNDSESPTPQLEKSQLQLVTEALTTFAHEYENAALTLANHADKDKASLETLIQQTRADLKSKFEAWIHQERSKPTRRWVPPYAFTRHAEFFDEFYFANPKKPVLAYVGTVVHEKFLRRKGQEPSTGKFMILKSTEETNSDLALDRQIYDVLEEAGVRIPDDIDRHDKRGWQALLHVLSPDSNFDLRGPNGEDFNEIGKLNSYERAALQTMMNNWVSDPLMSSSEAYVRNQYGLDPVLLRRALVHFWNDPRQYFRPAIYEGEGATIRSAALNLRILASQPPSAMRPLAERYFQKPDEDHPRRISPIRCTIDSPPLTDAFTDCFDLGRNAGFNTGDALPNPDFHVDL